MNDSITSVPGVEVGHWAHDRAMTGCTVVVFPEPNTAAAEARGAAPATREYALLQHGMRVEQIQAVLLTGGSAFGLAAADGVVAGLERDGRGHETPVGRVPIVPGAVIFDLFDDFEARPDSSSGLFGYSSRSAEPVASGLVGAGRGATVAKWRGLERRLPGGLGSAAQRVGSATVGALVVANAAGDIFALDGRPLTGGPHAPGPPQLTPEAFTNTTLVVLATDATLGRTELGRLIVRSHDALGACVRPVHTRYDGDVVFAVSAGSVEEDVDALGEAAFVATATAIEDAVVSSANSG